MNTEIIELEEEFNGNILEITDLQCSFSESKRFMIVGNDSHKVKSYCSTDKLLAKATYGHQEILGVDDNETVIYISSLNTDFLYQKRGYASRILKEIKKYYDGFFLYLFVGAEGPLSNKQLVEFYSNMGFKYVGLKFNHPVMVCDLRK